MEDIDRLVRQSQAVQDACNEALWLALVAVDLARRVDETAKTTDPASLASLRLSGETSPEELRALLTTYAKVAALKFEKNIVETDPAVIRTAIKLLEIIP
jgi:hypothetical protein